MDKLNELMDGLVAEKSLSFDVLEQLRKVKIESDELIKTNQALSAIVVERDKTISTQNNSIVALSSEVATWKGREDSLVARENAVLNIEHKNEIEKLKATHADDTLRQVKDVVSIVFKNTNVRKRITGQQPVSSANPNNYPSNTVDTTEEVAEE